MEGNWRIASLVGAVLICAVMAAAGCGSDSSGSEGDAIETRNPEATFAPLIQLDRQERWLPMGASWFLDRSSFWFAEDQGCEDRKIAVGDLLYAEWTPVIDSLSHEGLGQSELPYFRTPYGPAGAANQATATPCPFREGYKYYANQQTRPFERRDRVKGLRLGEGYYLSLTDPARKGQRPRRDGQATTITAKTYVERHAEEVDGEDGLRLTYWQLYGMNQPHGPQGPIEQRTHEGDWERVDVLLKQSGEDEYVPVAVRVHSEDGARDVPWASLRRAAGGAVGASGASGAGRAAVAGDDGVGSDGAGDPTHPVLTATLGDHTLTPAPRAGDCADCPQWPTWSLLAPLRKQPWYGFGGAWGEPGPTSATTGPLGPHGKWPPDSDFNEDT
jgi:hypothetical protein